MPDDVSVAVDAATPDPEQPKIETPTQPARPRGLWPREGAGARAQAPASEQPAYDGAPFTAEEQKRFKLPAMDEWLAVRVLSEAESKRLRDDLKDALRRYGRRMDQAISASTRDGTQARIWSNIPDADLDSLVDAWLELGKINKLAAQAARGFVRVNKLADAGLIVGLKLLETQQHYMLHGFEAMGLGAILGQMALAGQNAVKGQATA